MEDEYDVLVLGTGLTECILAGLLAAHGKKVLHVDRNSFYGGETASVNLTNLFKLFCPGTEPPPHLGANRDWNIDLIPKFTMANGKLVKIILHTQTVANSLDWKCVEGTYVMQVSSGGFFSKGGVKIHKVPATEYEAATSSLMGLWEKKRCKKFFKFCDGYNPANPVFEGINLQREPFSALIRKFSLEQNTVDFIGHAIALNTSEEFVQWPSENTVMKIKLYMDSIGVYGDSPYIYPIYGIGGIPEGFSRLSAIWGGVYMLEKPVDEILFDESGKVVGIRSGEEVARAPVVLCDPSYVREIGKVRQVGQVIRSICILNHPIPNTHDAAACQIIVPQRQTGRRNDIYIGAMSYDHRVCAQGFWVAICSTFVETGSPEAELQPAYNLLGPILHSFVKVYDIYEPAEDGLRDNLFISKSFDATSHFESACEDVLSLYARIMGEPLDYSVPLRPQTQTTS
jgi:Rab GDP dissociation inhibitor